LVTPLKKPKSILNEVDANDSDLLPGDDATVFLWRQSKEKPSMVKDEEEFNEEFWSVFKSLRGHLDDIYDLCWSKSGQQIITGKNQLP
jgi:WD40 repeat protein